MKKLSITLCIVGILSGFTLTTPGVSAETVTWDYQLSAPEDFTRSFYEKNEEYAMYSLVFQSDEIDIWISYEDFDSEAIQLFSIEDKVAGKAFVYLSETGAKKRKTESKGTLLPGAKLHFDENNLAHGQVMAELYPAGNSGWAEGEPISAKLVFSKIAALPE